MLTLQKRNIFRLNSGTALRRFQPVNIFRAQGVCINSLITGVLLSSRPKFLYADADRRRL